MSEHDDLLRRYTPRLRYDSNEQYFATARPNGPRTPATSCAGRAAS